METNYKRGARKEYKIVKGLKEKGWNIAQRTAGSHSPIDIIAIHKKAKIIKFIQSKPEKFNSKKIYEEMSWLNGKFHIIFEVI